MSRKPRYVRKERGSKAARRGRPSGPQCACQWANNSAPPGLRLARSGSRASPISPFVFLVIRLEIIAAARPVGQPKVEFPAEAHFRTRRQNKTDRTREV